MFKIQYQQNYYILLIIEALLFLISIQNGINIETGLDRKIDIEFDSIKLEEWYIEWTFHDTIKINIIFFVR